MTYRVTVRLYVFIWPILFIWPNVIQLKVDNFCQKYTSRGLIGLFGCTDCTGCTDTKCSLAQCSFIRTQIKAEGYLA